MMHILYIHQYFYTPKESGGTRSYWIAKKMIERGHRVTMITSTNNKLHSTPQKLNVDGINVVYVKNSYNQNFSNIRKIRSFAKFVYKAIKAAVKVENVDVVYATSTPLTVGAIALYLKKIKKINYFFEVRDLWPEFPIQIGAIKNKLLINILKKFEKSIYENANHLVALSPGMAEGIVHTGIAPKKVTIIPNMSKPDLFYPRKPSLDLVNKYNINLEKLNIVHFGAMGVANGLEHLIDTAKLLKQYKVGSIHFYLLGTGAMFSWLQNQIKDNQLDNVDLVGSFNLFETSEFVNCCDISFVSFKDLPILYTNSPNKLFDSLSAGKPIIVNSAGWTKDLVEDNKCGYYVSPKDPELLVKLLTSIDKQSDLYGSMCREARLLSINVYDKSLLSSQVVDVLER